MDDQNSTEFEEKPPVLPGAVMAFIHSLIEAGGRPLLVGGWVRDRLLGIDSKDLDIEVFGLPVERLRKICRRHGRLMTVGAAFAVLKLTFPGSITVDVSVPRTETLTGRGHKDFAIHADPHMDVRQAALRRDLTINAISMEPLTGRFVDPVGGIPDIRHGRLHHIGAKFSEDPLRVLRVYQFEARLGFEIDPETRELCSRIADSGALKTLPKERIEEELRKMMLRGRPDTILRSLRHMREDRIVKALFQELDALGEIPQDPRYHSEGDVLEHTFRAVSQAACIARRDGLNHEDSWHLCIAALLHDLGKRETTTCHADGRITAHGHDAAGLGTAELVLARITSGIRTRDVVLSLIRNHMRPLQLAMATKVGDGAIRRLALAVLPSTIDMLCKLVEADTNASIRGDGKQHENAHLFLRERAERLGVQTSVPEPVIHGRDLIELAAGGVLPPAYRSGGPHFGILLDRLYEMQLDSLLQTREDAIDYLKKMIGNKASAE